VRKRVGSSYFLLAFICFALLNFRFPLIEKIRGPFFGFEELFAAKTMDPMTLELSELKAENLQLKSQLNEVQGYLLSEDHIESIYKKCVKYESTTSSLFSSFYQRRLNHLIDFLSSSRWQVTANVIYREPANWSSALWVDAGLSDNKKLGKEVIAVNSPVIFGDHLIGVIEKVEKNKSLVRLITDSRVAPSVRCVRGYEQHALIRNHLERVKELLILQSDSKYKNLLAEIDDQIISLTNEGQTEYLAKGILSGSSNPIWRSRSHILHGTGFNYDFGDEEGPPRSLHANSDIPLFQKGDALLTTGMDGVFPAGLLAAFVTEVTPMKEGAVSCDLKAKISLPEFSDLTKVTILPPLS
jgi:rod shape-determining protein MreC